MVNNPSSRQGNLFASYYSSGSSRYAPRKSFDHHENLPAAQVGVGRRGLDQPPGLQEVCARYDRVLPELREDVEHEHSRRHDLLMTVRCLRTDREKDRSEFAFARLEK